MERGGGGGGGGRPGKRKPSKNGGIMIRIDNHIIRNIGTEPRQRKRGEGGDKLCKNDGIRTFPLP